MNLVDNFRFLMAPKIGIDFRCRLTTVTMSASFVASPQHKRLTFGNILCTFNDKGTESRSMPKGEPLVAD